MRKSCKENGWTAVSMKDDWTTIYGEDVTRKADEKAAEATTEAATEAVTDKAA